MRARWRLRGHAVLDDRAREGDLVKVTGTVRPLEETLVAPLSGRHCIAYRARVSGATKINNKQYSRGWQTTMQVRPFVVDRDGGAGQIIVVGDHVVFGVHPESLRPRNPDREVAFIVRHAIQPFRVRLDEVVVEVGAHVSVGGTLVLVPRDEPPTGERGFRDLPPPDQQLAGNRESPLVIVPRDDW